MSNYLHLCVTYTWDIYVQINTLLYFKHWIKVPFVLRCCYKTKSMRCKKKILASYTMRNWNSTNVNMIRSLNYSLLEIEFNIWAYQPSVFNHLVKDKHIYYSTFIMVIYCTVLWPNFMARSLNIYDTFFFLVSIVTLHVRYVFFFGGDFFAHRSWNLLYVLFLM